jgi:hypothetical protein
MRWILIMLLLLNMALFAWFWRSPSVVEPSNIKPSIEDSPALVLLSEVQAPSAVSFSNTQMDEAVAACYELGPFKDSSDVEEFNLIHQDSFSIRIERRQMQMRVDYRVYLPPSASREAAESALQELRGSLQSNNLAIDSLLITRGDLENGLALGLFTEQRNALNVEMQLEQLGYKVLIIEEPRTQEQWWISLLELPKGAQLLPQWPVIQQQRPYLQRIEKLC